MSELLLREGGPPVEAVLPTTTAEYLREQRIVDLVCLGPERWLVTPKTKVGAINVNGLTVRIDPKLDDINHLVFMLGYTSNPRWDSEHVRLDRHDDFVSALADAFARSASAALGRGLLQGYREVEDAMPVLRGRLRDQEQLRRQFGIAVPLLVRYDDYTVNVAENQIMHTAVDRLLRLSGLRSSTLHALRSLRSSMVDVDVIGRGRPLPFWLPSRLNERYQPALRLAELVLSESSFSHRSGSIQATGFLVEMSKVFEDFLCGALTHALAPFGGRCDSQLGDYLDEGERVKILMDFVWSLRRGRPSAVVDAKYKAEKPEGFPNADVYQMLAYCTALGLDTGHLVYAKGNEVPARHVVRNAGVVVHCHALDLSLRPALLLEQVAKLAEFIVSKAPAESLATSVH